MTPRRRLVTAFTALVAGGLLLIGAAGQLAKMVTPDATAQAAHKRISDVAPILIGGFLIGSAAHTTEEAPAQGPETVVLAMNKAELVG